MPGSEKGAGTTDSIDVGKYHHAQQTVIGNIPAIFSFKIIKHFSPVSVLIKAPGGAVIRIPTGTRQIKVRSLVVKIPPKEGPERQCILLKGFVGRIHPKIFSCI